MATHAGVRVVGLSGGSAAGAVASQAVLGDIPWTPTAPAAFTEATVTEILIEAGRAVGVVAEARTSTGAVRRLTIRAQAVVLSCGTKKI